MITEMLSDPYVWIAVASLVVMSVMWEKPLTDGYHTNWNYGIRHWEELYVIAMCIPGVYLLVWVTTLLNPPATTFTVPLAETEFSMWAVYLGVLLALCVGVFHVRTLTNTVENIRCLLIRLTGFYTSILFGAGLSTAFVIGTHPDTATLEMLYQYHLSMSFYFLSQFQATLALTIPHIDEVLRSVYVSVRELSLGMLDDDMQNAVIHTYGIFENNFGLSLGGGVIGFAAGVATVGIALPLISVVLVNAGIFFGAVTGILIRNGIGIGAGVFGPVSAYFSTMGLMIAGHTFHEFMAITMIAIGAGVAGMSVWKGWDMFRHGAWLFVIGTVDLAVAAFLEVWINPPFINWFTGYTTLDPTLVPIAGTDGYMTGVLSAVVMTGIMAVVIAWMIRWVTYQLEVIV